MSATAPHPHIVPIRLYLAIFLALMAGTALTVWVAYQNLGWLNTPIALTIAVCKATLVVLYFMHVRWSSKLVWVFAAAGFLWLLLLFVFTFSDYMTRSWMPVYSRSIDASGIQSLGEGH